MPGLASVSFDSLKLDILGYMESRDNISIDPDKTKLVMDQLRPMTVIEIRSFLGLVGYYRRFIERFVWLSFLMTRLTRKGEKFE